MPRKIRILFLSANPDNTTQLRLAEECNLIDSKIQASPFREQFDLEQRHAVSLLELQAHLLRFKPNIVHFSGHGSEKGALYFENSDGYAEEVSQKALSELFRIINEGASDRKAEEDHIRCVVLSACYSLQQAKAIAQYVDCVIGIADAIKDKSATNFAASFYQGLGFGESVQTAFELGRNQLGLYDESDQQILKLEHRPELDSSKVFLADAASDKVDEGKVQERLENERRKKNLFDHCKKLLEESHLGLHNFFELSHAIEFDKDIQLYVINPKRMWYVPEGKLQLYAKQLIQHLYTSHRDLFDSLKEVRKQSLIEENLTGECLGSIREPVKEMLKSYCIADSKLDRCLRLIINSARESGKFVYSLDNHPLGMKFIPYDSDKSNWSLDEEFDVNEGGVDTQKIASSLNDLVQNIRSQFRPLYEARDKYDNITESCEKSFEEFFSNIQIGTAMLSGGCQYCLTTEFHDEKEISRLRAEIDEIHFKA